MSTVSEKQVAIDEINKLMTTWEPEYCRRLLAVVRKLHEAATADEAPPLDAAAIEELGMGRVHLGEDGKPLCNNRADSLRLRSIEDFKQIPIMERCGTCDRLLVGKPAPWGSDLASLSDQQRAYLRAIREKDQGRRTGRLVSCSGAECRQDQLGPDGPSPIAQAARAAGLYRKKDKRPEPHSGATDGQTG